MSFSDDLLELLRSKPPVIEAHVDSTLFPVDPPRFRCVHADGRVFTVRVSERKNRTTIKEYRRAGDKTPLAVYRTTSDIHAPEFHEQLGLALS